MVSPERLIPPRRPDAAARSLAYLRYAKWALVSIMALYLTLASGPMSRVSTVQLLVDDANRASVLGGSVDGYYGARESELQRQSDASFANLWEEEDGSSDGEGDDDAIFPVASPHSDDAEAAVPEQGDDGMMQINIIDEEESSKEPPAVPMASPKRKRGQRNRQSRNATPSVLQRPNKPGDEALLQLKGHLPPPIPHNLSTDIDIVSLTVSDDFPVLFQHSALASWLKYIQNVRSVTFIGRPTDYALFQLFMNDNYPQLSLNDEEGASPPIRWVNETYFQSNYRKRYRCPYPSVCQQLIKLHVFDLRTKLGMDYLGDNILIVDSDTVWSRNATFVYPDGRVQYWDARGTTEEGAACGGMDPVAFTEAITAGPVSYANLEDIGKSRTGPRKPTLSPYKACRRPQYPNSTGGRHIVHHMLFQFDVMMHLHGIVASRWKKKTLWEAFNACYRHEYCQSRIAEYELYFAFVSENYPQRVKLDALTNLVDYMGSSAICEEEEMRCCERKGVLLKGCHDHRIQWHRDSPSDPATVGDMCCPENAMKYVTADGGNKKTRRRAKGGNQ